MYFRSLCGVHCGAHGWLMCRRIAAFMLSRGDYAWMGVSRRLHGGVRYQRHSATLVYSAFQCTLAHHYLPGAVQLDGLCWQ